MRVIAGSARGMRLKVPRGSGTRPTGDRVKESLFNILGGHVEGARVLDLFAGSGSLGIEALSRGAKRVTFVERDPRVVQILKENLEHIGFTDRAKVLSSAAPPRVGALDPPFDLVFLDPPYDRGFVARTLQWLEEGGLFASGAVVVVEHSAKEEIPSNLQKVTPFRERAFGETRVTLLRTED